MALARSSPRSTRRSSTWVIAERMRSLPPVPSARSEPSSLATRVGAIIELSREPGASEWKPPGCRSASPSMLLSATPEATVPDPEPFDSDSAATWPSASSTDRCVVPRGT